MPEPSDQELIEKLAADLEIDTSKVYHVMVLGGIEMMGEIFDTPEADVNGEVPRDILFLNPIKIFKEGCIDMDGLYSTNIYFVEWNSCIDGPYTTLNPDLILSMNIPSQTALMSYLHAVYTQYYPPATNLVLEDNIPIPNESQSNIIDFLSYKNKH